MFHPLSASPLTTSVISDKSSSDKDSIASVTSAVSVEMVVVVLMGVSMCVGVVLAVEGWITMVLLVFMSGLSRCGGRMGTRGSESAGSLVVKEEEEISLLMVVGWLSR